MPTQVSSFQNQTLAFEVFSNGEISLDNSSGKIPILSPIAAIFARQPLFLKYIRHHQHVHLEQITVKSHCQNLIYF